MMALKLAQEASGYLTRLIGIINQLGDMTDPLENDPVSHAPEQAQPESPLAGYRSPTRTFGEKDDRGVRLTPRERQVLNLLLRGSPTGASRAACRSPNPRSRITSTRSSSS